MQGKDLKNSYKKEDEKLGRWSQFRDSWRERPMEARPPNMPFIYCLINSEHYPECLPGWPQRPGPEGNEEELGDPGDM